MRRLVIATLALAVGATVFAAWGLGAPGGRLATTAAPTAKPKLPPKPKRSKLPAAVRQRGKWVIGVKCDYPPFGFIDVQGNHAGYDVEVARRLPLFSFGRANRLSLVCVTTPSRIPTLQSKRVDIIVSTLTWTKARTEVIDFSIPYYAATGRLLVKEGSSVNSLRDLRGKTVVTTRGALYTPWTKLCIENASVLEVDSPSAAVLALKDGRADAFMFDDAFLLNVATQDRDLRMTRDKFLAIPWGIGIRKGDVAMKRYVDAALRRMQEKDLFLEFLRRNAPKRYISDFSANVPRPGKTIRYPVDRDAATDCTSS